MTYWKQILGATAAASILAAPIASVNAQEVNETMDNSWISLTGTVSEVASNHFMLDYGENDIEVVTSDSNWFSGNALSRGDRVTVSGLVDIGFFDDRELEARSVYMVEQDRLFSDPSAEAGRDYSEYVGQPADGEDMLTLTGRVTAIDNDVFTLDTGGQTFRVDVVTMDGNQLDKPADMRDGGTIEVGEHVVVTGRMDDADLFGAREIEAHSIFALSGTG